MLARGGPGAEDDDLGDGDGDGADAGSLAGSLWGTRDWDTGDPAGPPGAGGQDCGPAGFGSGQPFDVARPGPALAGAADRVHTGALRRVSDEELTGMIRAWRRLSSWATARELGAIAEFARRRPDEDPGPGTDSDAARRARARRAASGPPGRRSRPAQLRAQRRLPSPAGRTRRLRAPPPAERPGQPQRFRVPRLLRLAELTRRFRAPRLTERPGQPQRLRAPRLPRLAGRTRRRRRSSRRGAARRGTGFSGGDQPVRVL